MDFALGMHPLLHVESIDRTIRELMAHDMIAETLLGKQTVDALATKYFVDGDDNGYGKHTYEDVPEVGEASALRRIGITEKEKTEMIRRYGLEFVITYEMQKWGLAGQLQRGMRRLARNVANMINEMAYNKISQDFTVVGTPAVDQIEGKVKAGTYWDDATNGGENFIHDLLDAKAKAKQYGHMLDTAIISPELELALMKNRDFRDTVGKDVGTGADLVLLRGYIGQFMGINFIVDERFTQIAGANDTALLLERGVVGDLVDAEGLRTKMYNEEQHDRTVVRVTRFSTVTLNSPKAVYLIKNTLA